MKKITLSALAAAGLMAGLASGANAADLGGNCCADLEERVAELEATTARKGNRKVSLTISGWVANQVTFWDDGVEQNTYVTGIGRTLSSNVKFSGQATISPGWSAGYVLQIEADPADSLSTSQTAVSPATFRELQSYWFVKSETYGKLSVGHQSSPSDNAAILVDGSGSLVPANWVAFDALNFNIRTAAGGTVAGLNWGSVGACLPGDCYGGPTNIVRYDSPTFAGFSASASWGEDDIWDVALRYAGEVSGFKLAATVTYAEDTGGTIATLQSEYTQAGLYVQHIATGIFGLVNYGELNGAAAGTLDPDVWYFKAGLRQRWNPLGHTVLYGEYMISEEGGAVASSEMEWWGLGAVQEIDNAAMSLWAKYRQYSYDDNTNNFQDLDQFSVGALINF